MKIQTITKEELDLPVIKLDSQDSKIAIAVFQNQLKPLFFNSGMLASLPEVTGFKFCFKQRVINAQELVDGA